ncbi:MAG: hypothetical protein QXO39_06905 [Conexivisphaerales archaeon]
MPLIGMTYRDPHVEGVIGTRPKDGTHCAYQYESVAVSKLTLAVTPIGNGSQGRNISNGCWHLS